VLAASGGRRVDDTLRRAALVVESDLPPDPLLLEAAATKAIQLLDLSLAERLARAAVAAGAGFGARMALANALSWLSHGDEADQELAALATVAGNDLERVQVGFSRAANRFYTQRDPAGAEAVLAEAAATVADEHLQRSLAALRAAFEVHLGRPAAAVRTAREALAAPVLPDLSVVMASFGFIGGLGMLGRADELSAGAARAYAAGTGTSEAAVPCFGLGHLHIIGLRLAGYLAEAERVAADRCRSGAKILGPPQLYGLTLLGQAAFASGRLQTAMQYFREARAGLTQADTSGFEAHCLLGLTEGLAKTGDAVAARRSLAELEEAWHPGLVYLQPELVLAKAWIAAAEGATTEAVALTQEAAGLARGFGQLAHEVLALQTAAGFGERTVGGRLAELADLVDGPRAPAAAAHAAALAADDGDAVRDASERLEELGDLLAAADAAAQAVVAYGRQGRNGAAQSAAARAERLVAACEGARTPALRAAAKPLPLTEREREIVALAALGLANRAIADRLMVSVRTVEGHLYRASAKLGTTDRAEFAALLRGD
jgi:DNA-binding NarL/FixJ family response regulator